MSRALGTMLCLGLMAGVSAAARAADPGEEVILDIPAQTLESALLELARQGSFQLVISAPSVPAVKAPALSGKMRITEALERLLGGTELGYRWVGDRTLTVAPKSMARPARTSYRTNQGTRFRQSTEAEGQQLPGDTTERQATIDEVLVTATRRELRLQEVPLAVTALTGVQLERTGADGFADFFRSVPGLAFNQADANLGNFSIRGVSQSVMSGNTQSTVALYIDDLPTLDSFGTSSVPDLKLFDIERVEVLRGPQGTLFGSGAMGGAIRVITRKPELDTFASTFAANVAHTRDGDMSYGLNSMVNVPLSEGGLAMRAVGYYRDTGGYVDNTGTGVEDANSEEAYGGRLAFKWQANDDLAFLVTATHQYSQPEDSAGYQQETASGWVHEELVPRFTADRLSIGNFVINYDLGWAELHSSTSYARHRVQTQADISVISPFIVGTLVPSPQEVGNEIDVFTQEIRLASASGGDWSWLIGAFYLDSDRESALRITVPGAGAVLGPFGFPSDVIFDALIGLPNTEKALFGEIGYQLTDRLQATVGARLFANSSTYDENTTGFLNGGDSANVRRTEEEKLTPKFVLSWQATPNSMIYATAAQGYRVGQNNPVIPTDQNGQTSPASYEADTLWNYELGAKSSWLDNRVMLNGAIYRIKWTNMQVGQQRPDGFAYIANVGSAHSQGVELELLARPIPAFELSTALSVGEAELDEDNVLLSARKGDRLPGAPRFTIATGIQYGFSVSDRHGLYARADHQYVGNSYSSFNRNVALEMGDYHNLDLRIGLNGNRWELALFSRNVLDAQDVITAQGTTTGTPRYYLLRPRTIGLDLRMDF